MAHRATSYRSFFNRIGAFAALVALGAAAPSFAGQINPPVGPVGPSGPSLVDVEPRTAMNFINTPGDLVCWFRITQPGSYYLTSNLVGLNGQCGICIASSDVTIDLNGFTVRGIAASLDGVCTEGGVRNRITIRNGKVIDWDRNGIDLMAGGLSRSSLIEDVQVNDNDAHGIQAGQDAIVHRCSATGNGTFGGSHYGISVQNGSLVDSCTVSNNMVSGIFAIGSAVIKNCSSWNHNLDGIVGNSGASIIDCVAVTNSRSGINVTSNCLVRGNNCVANIGSGMGANILVTGTDNLIDSNHCTDGSRGVHVTGPHNIIVRNTCTGTSTSFDFAATNRHGPVVDIRGSGTPATSSSTAPSTMLTTDEYANFVK